MVETCEELEKEITRRDEMKNGEINAVLAERAAQAVCEQEAKLQAVLLTTAECGLVPVITAQLLAADYPVLTKYKIPLSDAAEIRKLMRDFTKL